MRPWVPLLVLAVSCRPPSVSGVDAGAPQRDRDDGGVMVTWGGPVGDAGVDLLRASATVFHWNTAWNEPSVQSLSRPMIDRYLTTRVGVVLLEHEWPDADATVAPADAASEAVYDAQYAQVLSDVLGRGGTVLLQLAGPPRWASSSSRTDPIVPGQNNRPIWSVAPPSSSGGYVAWRGAVAGLTRWLRRTHPAELKQGRVWLAYGAELNNEEFYGDLALYAPAWAAFAEAARGVESSVRVGGGGKLDAVTPKSKPTANRTTEPVMVTWLRGCAALSCRIDFILGHNFTMSPIRWADLPGLPRDDFEALGDELAAAMASVGTSPVPLVLTDWISWELKDRTRHPWLSSEHDTEYRAAHLTASLVTMAKSGYGAQTQGALFETVSSLTDEFSGDWGLFSRRGITKASFHATALASRLVGPAVSLETGDRFVSGLGATEGGTVRLLVTRFVPDTEHGAKMLVASLGSRLVGQGYTDAKLAELGCAGPALQQLASSLDRAPCASARPPLSTTLDAWFELLRAAQGEPERRTARLRVPWAGATAHVRVAQVDEAHSNPGPSCGANGCVDIAATNAGVGALYETEVKPSLDGGSVEVELALGLRAVVLVTVEP